MFTEEEMTPVKREHMPPPSPSKLPGPWYLYGIKIIRPTKGKYGTAERRIFILTEDEMSEEKPQPHDTKAIAIWTKVATYGKGERAAADAALEHYSNNPDYL